MNRLIFSPVLLGGLLLSLYACAQQPAEQPAAATPQVSLSGQILTLHEQEQRCVLRKSDGSLMHLDIPWPCAFSEDRKGLPRVEKFDSAEIVIVYHSRSEPAPSKRCTSQFQAVRLLKGQLEASVVSRNGMCMRGPVDQKNFVGLFQW